VTDIDGEIQHAGFGGLVSVVARRGTCARIRAGHVSNSSGSAGSAGGRVGDNGKVTVVISGTLSQLVIFDLDGTLTDSAHGVVWSFRHALATVAELRRVLGA
jgi:hypothetical protein